MSSVVSSPVLPPSVPSVRAPAFTDTHERIVEASYRLFIHRSVRDVAMDEIVVASGVARATLYRHFATKDALVLAILERREADWTFGIVEQGARSRSEGPEGGCSPFSMCLTTGSSSMTMRPARSSVCCWRRVPIIHSGGRAQSTSLTSAVL